MIQARESGLPVVTVAAFFQKDPLVLIAHDDVKSFADMKGKTILIGSAAHQGFWPWLKARYGFTDAQTRPYTFNVQPFVADRNIVQQGYVTSEPYAIQQAGVKANVFLFGDYGYPAYSTTVSCMDKTVRSRKAAVAAFVKASAEGWKSYLADPAPGNALIKKDNPAMTDDQLAYGVAKLKETGLVTGGDAARLGIGVITEARLKASYDFLVGAGLVDPCEGRAREDLYDRVREGHAGPAVTSTGVDGPATTPVIEALSAQKTYPDGTQALQSVDLAVAEGEFVTLIGPSGCGKSTLLKMVAGLLDPSDGRVLCGAVRCARSSRAAGAWPSSSSRRR